MTQPIIYTKDLNLFYGKFQALKDIRLSIDAKKITSIIGPSGCGKSTLLRVFNRMNDLVEGALTTGQVLLDGDDIHNSDMDLLRLRKKVGMVFQRPNPFPLSIFENVVFGLRIHSLAKDREDLQETAKNCLESVLFFD